MDDDKKKVITSLKKAHTSLAKIIEMNERREYCIKIMQQNLAVIGLLRSAHETLMRTHLNTCFKKALSSGNEKKKREMLEEILQVTKLFNK